MTQRQATRKTSASARKKGTGRSKPWTLSKEKELLALYNVIAVVANAATLEKACTRIVETVSRCTGFGIVAIERYLPEEDLVEVVGHCGIPHRNEGRRSVPLAQALSRDAITSGKPSVELSPLGKEAISRKLNAMTFVSVPLKAHRKIIGALSVASETQRPVPRDLIRFLRTLATETATLIDAKIAEQSLKESEEKYRELFSSAGDGIFLLDADSLYVLDANPTALKLTGLKRKQIVGRSVMDLHTSEESEILKKTLGVVARKGTPQSSRTLHYRPNGKPVSAEISARPVTIGNRKMIVLVARDITEQEKSEVKLAASEELLRIIVEGTPDVFFYVHDVNGNFTYVSPSVEKMTGHSVEEWKGHYTKFLTPNPMNELVKTYSELAMKYGTTSPSYTCEILHAQGHPILLEINERPVFKNRKVIGVQGVARDITERKSWEKNLMESEKKYRQLFHSVSDGIFQSDRSGRVQQINRAGAEILGYSTVEAALESGINWQDLFVHPADRQRVTAELETRGVITGFQFLARKRSSDEFYLDWTCTTSKGDDQQGVECHGTFRDVTEKKRLEEAILESREYLNRIISQTPLAVQVSDAEGYVIDVNEAWLRLFGAQSKESVIGINILKSRFGQDHDVKPYVNAAFKGASVDIPPFTIDPSTARSVKLSGTERTIHAKLFPVFDRNEKLVNVVAMIEDVTDKRKLEEQLLHSQKMESIGLLAGGIAHDFNNILGGILGYSSYLKTVIPKEDRIFSHLDTIERSALRAAELTAKLLAFARGGKYVVRPIDINAVIDETIRLLRGSMDKSIIIESDLAPDLPATEADAGQMQQVLMNLCVNARDAMPGGGKITIVSELLSNPEEILSFRDELRHHSYIRIAISDTGMGMDKAVMARIFEPFFTTKEKGKGTGLGLATVYGIVKNHGGFLDVKSEVGVGTTFTLYLQAVDKEAVELETSSHAAEGGNETILIVDDEEIIRSLAREILESKGYRVLEAADGVQAVEVYGQHGPLIDLVVLDMAMPLMSGGETYTKLRELNKKVSVILSTGYAEDDRARNLMAQGVRAFVQKPYKVDEFAAVVRKVLDLTSEDSSDTKR